MASNITSIFRQDTVNKSNDKITETLSKYTEKKVNKDNSVTYKEIATTYFLENNKWHIVFFADIEQCWCQYKFPEKGKENSPPLGIINSRLFFYNPFNFSCRCFIL